MPIFLRWLLRLGPANPIAVRLVQGGSRRRRHLYIRGIYLGILIVALLYYLVIRSGGVSGVALNYRGMAAAAAEVFTFIAYLQIALICLLAPVFMAGAISQEADPKTWDILLTTPLSAPEIVLGNLLGRLFFILALLFSSLPLFALTQYFGGVPGKSIFMSYLIAGGATTLVGTIAIALSVSRLVGKRAVFAFYVSVISYLVVTAAIDAVLAGGSRVTHMTAVNPFLALRALLNPTGYVSYEAGSVAGISSWFLESPVATWCLLSAGISLVLAALSSFTVRIGGLTQLSSSTSKTVPWYRKMLGLGRSGADSRPAKVVWANAIAWREASSRNATLGRILARWSFIGAGGLFGIGITAWYHFKPEFATETFRTTVMATVWGELLVISLIAINMAATAVAKEREDGTLDLLLTTPITPGAYLTGKLRGLVAYLLPLLAVPIGTLLIAGAYIWFVQIGTIGHHGGVDFTNANPDVAHAAFVAHTPAGRTVPIGIPAIIPEAGLLAALVGIPFLAFCIMIGLQWSLKSKGSLGSVVATVGVVGVVSGIVGLCAWQGGGDIPGVGPALAALSPATTVYGTVVPEIALAKTIDDGGVGQARVGMLIGAIIAACVYLGIVYGIHANMVRTFDMTVRKLAGTR